MRRRKLLAGLGLAVITAAAVAITVDVASAQFRPGPGGPPGHQKPDRPGTWSLLGTQKVGFRVDRDVIRVGRQDGRFRALKLRVHGNDINLISITVVYGNGQPDRLPFSHFIRKGGETPVLDLKGNKRFIKEVHLTYKSKPSFRGQATVELFGLH